MQINPPIDTLAQANCNNNPIARQNGCESYSRRWLCATPAGGFWPQAGQIVANHAHSSDFLRSSSVLHAATSTRQTHLSLSLMRFVSRQHLRGNVQCVVFVHSAQALQSSSSSSYMWAPPSILVPPPPPPSPATTTSSHISFRSQPTPLRRIGGSTAKGCAPPARRPTSPQLIGY